MSVAGMDEMTVELGASAAWDGRPGSQVAKVASRCMRFGGFHLDQQRQELWKDGAQVKIQGKVYQALTAMLESPGEIVTREMLRKHLWPRDSGLNYDANVNTTVNKLRGVLGDTDDEAKFIETIPRRGYSFVAKVEYVDELPIASVGERIDTGVGISDAPRRGPAKILNVEHAHIWFTAGVVALVIAAMLFGAAITLYSNHKLF